VIDLSTVRLGRRPHDPARVATLPVHAAAAAPIPAAYPDASDAWVPTLANNTVLPTCTVAGLANSARRWAAAQGFDLPVVDQKLYNLYAAVAGCQPTQDSIAATDGLNMLDLLQHVAANGFDYGAPGPMSLTTFRINVADLQAVRAAIFGRRSAYVGIRLYQCDMVAGAVWRGAPTGPEEGLHCLVPWLFRPGQFSDATWGETIDCDDAWLAARIEEGYALAWGL